MANELGRYKQDAITVTKTSTADGEKTTVSVEPSKSGAVIGAAVGAPFGPLGAAIGGVIGCIFGPKD